MIYELPVIEKIRDSISNYSDQPMFFISLYVIIPITLLISFLFMAKIIKKINHLEKNPKHAAMRTISEKIQHGAKIYLKDQSTMLFILLAILCIPVGINGLNFMDNPWLSFFLTVFIFIIGSLSSLLASYIGMISATKANIFVVEASIDDPEDGFKIAYVAGMITGILNISMFVLGIWLIFLLTNQNIYLMVSYNFGASVSALLAQVGGGIFTKSADMGADLVGKFDLGLNEDDPRNPAIIADLVGDNVGDCAGRGADLFESASSDAVGGMVLGMTLFILVGNPIFIISDLTLVSLGLLSLYFTLIFLKIDFKNPTKSIWRVFVSATLFNLVLLFIVTYFLFGEYGWILFLAGAFGLLATFIVIIQTTYHTSIEYKPTSRLASASDTSTSLNVLSGLSNGLASVFIPILVFVISIIFTYWLGIKFGEQYVNAPGFTGLDIFGKAIDPSIFIIAFGIWGVNMASVSSDIIISTILSFDTFGPIMDNAAGIVEMGGGGEEEMKDLRVNLDKLDALGNTTKAIAKGFALVCGGFSSIVMFFTFLLSATELAPQLPNTYIPATDLENIFHHLDLWNPLIIAGFFIGVAIPVLFSSMIINATLGGAKKMVREVKRQFDTIPGLKEGKEGVEPDFDKCIDVSAKNALNHIIKPVLSIIVIVLVVGILLGPMSIAGLLLGNLIGSLIFGLFMSVAGGSMDNAKKGIEDGLHGGKGSKAHMASIIGDTVGDPLKDVAGPSMNIIITTINTLALTFLPLFIMTGYLWNLF